MTITPTLLRRVLWLDALSGLGMAALFLIAGGLVSDLTGLPRGLLTGTAMVLIVIAGGILLIAARDPLPRLAVRTLAIVNLLWVVDSIALLIFGWVDPTSLGYALVIGQAVVVAVLAELQLLGLRRPRLATA
ncbi:hypothetical protein P7L68_20955 [Tistrella mobilis]|uniref:hypothetical protein n=1 Tax=Tistrella mobilis TaxID=171437 RepID=UPI003556290C